MEEDDADEDIEEAEMGLDEIERELAALGIGGSGLSASTRRTSLQTLGDDDIVDMSTLDMHYQMPQLLKRHVRRFNEALQRSATRPQDLQSRRDLWAMYLRCSNNMPGFLDQITDEAWKVLWRSQSAEPFFNQQAGHLLKLANDMQKVGISLTPTQNLTRIKALEAAGQTDEALEQWHLARRDAESNGNIRHEFAALGVALECARGQPQEAQDIAFSMIRNQKHNLSTTRLLIPVIAAWAKKGSEDNLKQAWVLYLLVRQTLGKAQSAKDAIVADDFDQVYLGFVDAGRKDIAVLVFKDLIIAGQQSRYDSLRLYKSYNKVLDDLHRDAKVPEQVHEMSIDILSKLPRKFENKFFYASWMKRLIGMGRVDAALSVMELMYERGISPDAKHVNGIIGAWLRGGTPENQKTALDLAWMMVDERLKLLDQRHKSEETDETVVDPLEGVRIPVHLRRPVPAATTETLCLLLLHYSQNKLSSEVGRIQELLTVAELRPNSYFLNHTMYYYHHQGKWAEAWDLYNKTNRKVTPDMATFACLWDCAHGVIRRYEQTDKFPAPRRLFSTMMNWYSQLPSKAKITAKEEFSAALYSRIAQVFMHHKDTKGMVVALYAMRDSFGLYPDDETIRAVTMQIAQMGEPRQAGHPIGRSRTRRRKASGMDLHRNIERAGKVLSMIHENRVAELSQQGIDIAKFDVQQEGEEALFVLAEFLRAADRQAVDADAESEDSFALSEEVDKVAWEMGAGPFKFGAPVYNRQ